MSFRFFPVFFGKIPESLVAKWEIPAFRFAIAGMTDLEKTLFAML